jgi:hypothetical protein
MKAQVGAQQIFKFQNYFYEHKKMKLIGNKPKHTYRGCRKRENATAVKLKE